MTQQEVKITKTYSTNEFIHLLENNTISILDGKGELYNKDNGKRIPLICHAEYLKRLRKDYPLVIWNNN